MATDLAETLVDPVGSGDATQVFDAALQHHGRMIVSAILLLASALFIVPAVFALLRVLETRGRRLGYAAAVLALLGALGHAALAAIYLVWAEIPSSNGSRDLLIAAIHRTTDSPSFVILVPLFLAFPFSLLAILTATVRAGLAPRWVLVPVVAAPVVTIIGPGSDAASTGAALVLLMIAAGGLVARAFGGPRARTTTRTDPAPA